MTYQISKYELKATEAATVTKTNRSEFALGGSPTKLAAF